MPYDDSDWYMDYDAMTPEDLDESHLTASLEKKIAAKVASTMAAAEAEAEEEEDYGPDGEENGGKKEYRFTGLGGWVDPYSSGEEKKKKVVLTLKRTVPVPVPPVDVLSFRRLLGRAEAEALLEKFCGNGARFLNATLVTWHETADEHGRSCGPCHALWFSLNGSEFCLWVKYSERRRAWLAVKAFLVSDAVSKNGRQD